MPLASRLRRSEGHREEDLHGAGFGLGEGGAGDDGDDAGDDVGIGEGAAAVGNVDGGARGVDGEFEGDAALEGCVFSQAGLVAAQEAMAVLANDALDDRTATRPPRRAAG